MAKKAAKKTARAKKQVQSCDACSNKETCQIQDALKTALEFAGAALKNGAGLTGKVYRLVGGRCILYADPAIAEFRAQFIGK